MYKYIDKNGEFCGYGDGVINGDGYQNREVTDEEYQLYKLKQDKIMLNDELRDIALFGGVEYQGVLFDSDTDQKTNLIGTILSMSDEDTITWYGMDNQGLLCTKVDLYAISNLIKDLHGFCWSMNAYLKEQIAEAETLEELEAIVIDYTMPSEE